MNEQSTLESPWATKSKYRLGVEAQQTLGRRGGMPDSLSIRCAVPAPGYYLHSLHPFQGLLGRLCEERIQQPPQPLSAAVPCTFPHPLAIPWPLALLPQAAAPGWKCPLFNLPWFEATPTSHQSQGSRLEWLLQLREALLPAVLL